MRNAPGNFSANFLILAISSALKEWVVLENNTGHLPPRSAEALPLLCLACPQEVRVALPRVGPGALAAAASAAVRPSAGCEPGRDGLDPREPPDSSRQERSDRSPALAYGAGDRGASASGASQSCRGGPAARDVPGGGR